MSRFLLLNLALACLLLTGCGTDLRPDFAANYRTEAVAADHPVASDAGAEILRRGGNAIDAAVATSFTLSVVRPYSCGIGGGGFMVISMVATAERPAVLQAVNYRETCPAAIGPDFYERRADAASSTRGGCAIAVPGTVAGLLQIHEKYGKLSRAAVLAPAIRAAEEGFYADAHYAAVAGECIANFNKHANWSTRFAFVWERYLGGGRIAIGDLITNSEQAAALRLIARDGAAAFYSGPIADAVQRAVHADGGVLSRDDLANYRPRWMEPLVFQWNGRTVCTMPPPSSGGIALAQILGVMQRRQADLSPGAPPGQFEHLFIEASKHAFADRARWLGDPDFVDVPVQRLLAPGYLDNLAASISLDHPLPSDRYGTPDAAAVATPEDHGTSHLCVVDRFGNAVACTETINLEFGSLLAVPEFGFCLNNEMDDFTTRSGAANAFGLRQSDRNLPQPGKRPLSSMTPTIVLDVNGRAELVAGASGGPRIISGTAMVILNRLQRGMSVRDSVAAYRVHHHWQPDVVSLEPARRDPRPQGPTAAEPPALWFPDPLDPAVRAYLESRGHALRESTSAANTQAIGRDRRTGELDAAGDPRKGGRPGGR